MMEHLNAPVPAWQFIATMIAVCFTFYVTNKRQEIQKEILDLHWQAIKTFINSFEKKD